MITSNCDGFMFISIRLNMSDENSHNHSFSPIQFSMMSDIDLRIIGKKENCMSISLAEMSGHATPMFVRVRLRGFRDRIYFVREYL